MERLKKMLLGAINGHEFWERLSVNTVNYIIRYTLELAPSFEAKIKLRFHSVDKINYD